MDNKSFIERIQFILRKSNHDFHVYSFKEKFYLMSYKNISDIFSDILHGRIANFIEKKDKTKYHDLFIDDIKLPSLLILMIENSSIQTPFLSTMEFTHEIGISQRYIDPIKFHNYLIREVKLIYLSQD